jgi:hypothetical protein
MNSANSIYFTEPMNGFVEAVRDNQELVKQVKHIEMFPEYLAPADIENALEFMKLVKQKGE